MIALTRCVRIGLVTCQALWAVFAVGGCTNQVSESSLDVRSASAQRILGGTQATECEWPAVIALGGCSGVLVHPRLVLYAAHCGTAPVDVLFGTSTSHPRLVAKTSYCRAVDGARLGDGSDLAYCVLEEVVEGIVPARVVAGCELEELTSGSPAILVGFGRDGAEGNFGTQRVGVSRVDAVGDELLLNGKGVDTCFGDSGGPLFVPHKTAAGMLVPRVAGITSAGTEDTCGGGTGHYVNLSKKIEWIEASSGIDITPCFDGANWRPTPRCVEVASLAGPVETAVTTIGTETSSAFDAGTSACESQTQPSLSSTCGTIFDEAAPDETAPSLALISPTDATIDHILGPNEGYIEFLVRAEASDDGWGVERVTFTLLSATGSVGFERIDEVPPYEIPTFRVPPGSFTLSVEAMDYAGNAASKVLSINVWRAGHAASGGGCSTAHAGYSGYPGVLVLMLLVLFRVFTTSTRSI